MHDTSADASPIRTYHSPLYIVPLTFITLGMLMRVDAQVHYARGIAMSSLSHHIAREGDYNSFKRRVK